MDSAGGLTAMPSWKQGTMRQGGPADTFLRRMVLPDVYSEYAEACTVDDNVDIDVDADIPIIESAVLQTRASDGQLVVRIDGTDADGDLDTLVQIRNAVTGVLYGRARADADDGTFVFSFLDSRYPAPCVVQAADADGSPEYGPWTVVVDANGAPLQECEGRIPLIQSAVLQPRASDGQLVVRIEGINADGLVDDPSTPEVEGTLVQIRNAVTGVDYRASEGGPRRRDLQVQLLGLSFPRALRRSGGGC